MATSKFTSSKTPQSLKNGEQLSEQDYNSPTGNYTFTDAGGKDHKFQAPKSGFDNPTERTAVISDYKNGAYKDIPSFKKGGRMKKTGLAYLHKGEKVLTKAKTEALEKKKGKKMEEEC